VACGARAVSTLLGVRAVSERSFSTVREGDARLYPASSHTRYYVLTRLREHLRALAVRYFPQGGEAVLVDYGCGAKPYQPLLADLAPHYIGVDFPGNRLADIEILPSGLVPLPSATADVVLSTQVLEHVPAPPTYLGECHRLLRPGGLLLLSTHGYWFYHPDPQDYWRWTSAGLRKLVADHGFSVIEQVGVLGLAPSAVQLLQDALLPRVWGRLRTPLAFCFQRLMMMTDRWYSSEQRSREAGVYVLAAAKSEGATP